MRKRLALVLAMLLVMSIPPAEVVEAHDVTVRDLRVMTRNLYSGADLSILFDAVTPVDLVEAAGKLRQRVRATKFRERARAIAAEIAATKPHVVGLQEVALWRTQSPGDGPLTAATQVEFDFLKILRQELAARGQNYKVAVSLTTFDIEVMSIQNETDLRDVRFTDRDVILVRQDHHLQLLNTSRGRFSEFFSINTPLHDGINYRRGWTAVDVRLDGRKARVVNTHLEALSGNIRDQQAAQLLSGPASVGGRVIVLGDLNFAPNDPTTSSYDAMLGAGFTDAWAARNGQSGGVTCCQQPNLKNATSQLEHRIDYIFFKGNVTARAAQRVGHTVSTRTASGLWPSDHAGVVAQLRLQ